MSAPWWYLAVELAPLVLIALVIVALIVEGLRRLWVYWRRHRG